MPVGFTPEIDISEMYLQEWRLLRRMTQIDLAEAAKLRVGTISDLERGEHTASEATILKLAKVLRVYPWQLFISPFSLFDGAS